MTRKHRLPSHVLGGSKRRGRRASWIAAMGIAPVEPSTSRTDAEIAAWAEDIRERCAAARARRERGEG